MGRDYDHIDLAITAVVLLLRVVVVAAVAGLYVAVASFWIVGAIVGATTRAVR